ncbi:MAG: metallophosphoesterase family protein, partial [Bacteriovoracia bacterium]
YRILVSHIPPDDQERFGEETINKFKNLMIKYDVSYYIAGHHHEDYGLYDFAQGRYILNVATALNKHIYELIFTESGVEHQKITL